MQREIETYLLQGGWFYDRRKNYYKNTGKARDRIVSIPLMAQSMMAIGLGEPDQARARPSSLLKNDDDYARVFPPSLNLAVYQYCLELQRAVDVFITERAGARERTNLRFQLAMLTAMRLVGGLITHPSQLTALAKAAKSANEEMLEGAIDDLLRWRGEYRADHPDLNDDVISKSSDFRVFLRSRELERQSAGR